MPVVSGRVMVTPGEWTVCVTKEAETGIYDIRVTGPGRAVYEKRGAVDEAAAWRDAATFIASRGDHEAAVLVRRRGTL